MVLRAAWVDGAEGPEIPRAIPAIAPPAPRRGGDAATWRECAFAGVAYALLGLWWLWPLPARLKTHTVDFPGAIQLVHADFALIAWTLAWVAHAMRASPLDLFRANIFHPAESSLALADHLVGLGIPFAPIFYATGDAAVAANIYLILLQPACAVSMYILARRFGDPFGAFIAGLLFGFAPSRLVGLAHFHILSAMYLPLALAFVDRWLEGARRRDGVALALVLALQGASAYYLTYALAFALALWVPFGVYRWRARMDARRGFGLLVAAAFALAVTLPLSAPGMRLREAGVIPSGVEDRTGFPFGLWPSAAATAVRQYMREGSVGPVGFALAAAGLWLAFRRSASLALCCLSIVLLGLLLAHGPVVMLAGWEVGAPYRLLVALLPGFGTVRVPARLVVVAQIGLSLLAGVGANWLITGLPRRLRGVGAVVLAGAALASHGALPRVALREADVAPPAYHWLAAHGRRRPLLELPAGSYRATARRMLLGTTHWLPTMNGYSGYRPAWATYLHRLTARLPDERALAELTEGVDLGWVLVHLKELATQKRQRWLGALPPGMHEVARFGDDLLIRVEMPGNPERRRRFNSIAETLEGHPLRAVGSRCPGEIVLVGNPARALRPASHVELAFEVQNHGDQAWPGVAFSPRHLVGLAACITPEGRRGCPGPPLPLAGDVPARGSLDVGGRVQVPQAPGRYAVFAELVQRGDPPLRECGVAPFEMPIDVEGAAPEAYGGAAAEKLRGQGSDAAIR